MKKLFLSLIIVLFVFGPLGGAVPLAHAQVNPNQNAYQDYSGRIGQCFTVTEGIDIGSCFAWIMYFFAWISSKFAELSAVLMDYFLAYSLDSGSYAGANNQFVEMGWSIIRDIANIFFIFTLLYIAIRHILQLGGDMKKLLVSLIIAALLINFSLFFTKIIIDGSNVLARAFYNNIEVENDDNVDHKTISQALVAKVNPQNLLSSDLFKPVNAPGRLPTETDVGWLVTIFGVATFVNVSMGLVFISTFLLFAARVIGLWFMMIFSPIALASKAIPGTEGMLGEFGWDGWIKTTLKLAFMAPIFVFFLFLLTMFLGIYFDSLIPVVEQSTMQRIMSVLIPFIAIIVILNKAKDTAKSMSGTFGEAVLKGVGKVAGVAMVATGVGLAGTAMVARATAGRAASSLADKKWFQNAASQNRFGVSRALYKANKAVSKGSLDARNSEGLRRTTSLLSQGLAAAGISAKLDLGKGTTRGGYSQRMEEFQKNKEKFNEELKSSEHDNFRATYVHTNPDGSKVDREVEGSVIEAEAAFLRAQNEAKRRDYPVYVTNADTGAQEEFVGDHDGWTKGKEKADKTQKQAETDYRTATEDHRQGRIGQPELDAARTRLDWAKSRNNEFKSQVKAIEDTWQNQEKAFKALKRELTVHDTQMVRQYAESTASAGPLGLKWVYQTARGTRGANNAAAAELAKTAEKEEKKAQAEAKKDEKKS